MSKLTGDWGKVNVALKNVKDLKYSLEEDFEGIGEDIAERIREFIENQELDFAPLTQEYLAKKIKQGYDPRVLIRTGEYVESIKVTEVDSDRDSIHIFISVEDGATETNLSMKELAEFIEYGTKKQPARLPFTQSWERMKGQIKREVERKIAEEVRKAVDK